jgi:5'-nucleotidase
VKTSRTLAAGMAAAMVCGTVGALSATTAANAATGSTATIHGQPVNAAGLVWYDSGTTGPTNTGTPRTASLTAAQSGADIRFTVALSAGPNATSFSGFAANSYRLDAYVRLDGTANTRGTRFAGTVGTAVVPAGGTTYAAGARITGTFKNARLGSHTLTLTDLLLDSTSASAGGGFGTPTGFDTFYNPSTAPSVTRADWALKQAVSVVDRTAPVVKVSKLKSKASKVKAIKGTIRDDLAGPRSVTIQVVEKRGSKWYAYKGKKWVKKASKAKAFKAAKKLTDKSVSSGAWSIKVKKVKKGTISVKYSGLDKAGNRSKVKTYSKKLK